MQCILWSLGIIILKYIYYFSDEELINLHKNYDLTSSILSSYGKKFDKNHLELLNTFFLYNESKFSYLYIMLKLYREKSYFLYKESQYTHEEGTVDYIKDIIK